MRPLELGVVGVSQVVMTDLEQPGNVIACVRELVTKVNAQVEFGQGFLKVGHGFLLFRGDRRIEPEFKS
jgi:hypothetical protein